MAEEDRSRGLSIYTGGVALCAHKAHHWVGGFAVFHWFLGVGVEESGKIAVSRGARLRDTCAALHVFRRRCLTPAGIAYGATNATKRRRPIGAWALSCWSRRRDREAARQVGREDVWQIPRMRLIGFTHLALPWRREEERRSEPRRASHAESRAKRTHFLHGLFRQAYPIGYPVGPNGFDRSLAMERVIWPIRRGPVAALHSRPLPPSTRYPPTS